MPNITELQLSFEKIVKKPALMRIHIDGDWVIDDFINLFFSINKIYQSRCWTYEILETAEDYFQNSEHKKLWLNTEPKLFFRGMFRSRLNHLLNLEKNLIDKQNHKLFSFGEDYDDNLFKDSTLIVKRIKYASPGFTDIVGLSGILQQIREMIQYYIPNKIDKEKAKLLEQERIEAQIKNLKEVGFTDFEIRNILLTEEKSLESLKWLIIKEQLNKIEILEVET